MDPARKLYGAKRVSSKLDPVLAKHFEIVQDLAVGFLPQIKAMRSWLSDTFEMAKYEKKNGLPPGKEAHKYFGKFSQELDAFRPHIFEMIINLNQVVSRLSVFYPKKEGKKMIQHIKEIVSELLYFSELAEKYASTHITKQVQTNICYTTFMKKFYNFEDRQQALFSRVRFLQTLFEEIAAGTLEEPFLAEVVPREDERVA